MIYIIPIRLLLITANSDICARGTSSAVDIELNVVDDGDESLVSMIFDVIVDRELVESALSIVTASVIDDGDVE